MPYDNGKSNSELALEISNHMTPEIKDSWSKQVQSILKGCLARQPYERTDICDIFDAWHELEVDSEMVKEISL